MFSGELGMLCGWFWCWVGWWGCFLEIILFFCLWMCVVLVMVCDVSLWWILVLIWVVLDWLEFICWCCCCFWCCSMVGFDVMVCVVVCWVFLWVGGCDVVVCGWCLLVWWWLMVLVSVWWNYDMCCCVVSCRNFWRISWDCWVGL